MVWNCMSNLLQLVVAQERIARESIAQPSVASCWGGPPRWPASGGGSTKRLLPLWASGDEPATAAQMSYLKTLAHDSGREIPDNVSKADASRLIDELRAESPRVSGEPGQG